MCKNKMKRFDYLIPSTANTPPYLSDYFKVLIQIIDVHRQQTLSLWFNFVENVDDVFRFVKKKYAIFVQLFLLFVYAVFFLLAR